MELVPDGSVRKTTVRAGQSGRTPPNGATVFGGSEALDHLNYVIDLN
jgi:hypothetical protein